MHIPDGLINAPTSLIGGVVAAGLVVVSVRKAADSLDDRQVPLAGLVAAFIFAMQMLNFPVAAGTSGHLLGGCLAAVLVGPWIGSLAMAVVFLVQALVFADGGLTALGLNIVMMGYVTCFGGYGIFLLIRKLLPASKGAVTAAAGVAAWFGVVLASIAFVAYYAAGGTGDAPIGTVALAMIGVHVLIGIGEAVITGLTVGAVLATRPDLVYGARDLRPALALAVSTATMPTAPTVVAQIPTAQIPTAQIPTAQIPTAQIPTAQIPTAQIPGARIPGARIPTGPVPAAPNPALPSPAVHIPMAPTPAAPTSAAPISAAPTSAAPISAAPISAGPTPAVPIASVPTSTAASDGEV